MISNNKTKILLRLSMVNGIGNRTLYNIRKNTENLNELFSMKAHEIAQKYQISTQKSTSIKGVFQSEMFHKLQNEDEEILRKLNCSVISQFDDGFPKSIREIDDSPELLYIRGDYLREDRKAIAIVGSRRPTAYGRKAAYDISRELAKRGFTIISGMASGVDTEAHKGALAGGGRTIAVVGTGIDTCYPKNNKILMTDIISKGAVISEFPLGAKPIPGNFPKRNRIISGLSLGVLVIEAGVKSGTMITVNYGLDQGKTIFATPGNIYSYASLGTNKLIRDGAILVTKVDDIMEELGFEATDASTRIVAKDDLSELEYRIYKIIERNQPLNIDELIALMDSKNRDLGGIVTVLEIKGYVERLIGNMLYVK